MIPKSKPTKLPAYLQWIRTQPCVICGSEIVEAHHEIGHGKGRMGGKHSDLTAFPLCPTHHQELHNHGYKTWERKHGHAQEYYWSGTLMRAIRMEIV